MQGVLNLYKPSGPTSHDVVARVRRVVGMKHVGHAGTLDPMARGVLVVCLGAATRIIEYWSELPKSYVAEMVLGIATDTQDTSGQVTEERPAAEIQETDLRAALTRFRGPILQVPPMVSAVKHGGERLYRLAREGRKVERAPRPVTIHALECLEFHPGERPRARLAVTCSGGTYVRTLCADIGAALGTGAAMSDLERTAVGPFRVEESLSLDDLATATFAGRLSERLISPADALAHLPAVVLDEAACRAVMQGRAVQPPERWQPPQPPNNGGSGLPPLLGGWGGKHTGPLRLLNARGELIAIARIQQQDGTARLAPEKVFGSPA
jgi:tRNA pseudouridine55 synthase